MAVTAVVMTIFSFLLLAAHFLRFANLPLVAVCALAPLLLLVRRHWAVTVLQLMLIAGAALWVLMIVIVAQQRIDAGRPWTRMAVILGVVAAFNLATVAALNWAPRKRG